MQYVQSGAQQEISDSETGNGLFRRNFLIQ